MISSLIAIIVINSVFFSLVFWLITFLLKFYYSNKNFNYKLNFYECGFKSLTNIKIQYNINFTLIMLFLLIYDGEFLILIPFALNISIINFTSLIFVILFITLLIITLLYDMLYNSLEWQI